MSNFERASEIGKRSDPWPELNNAIRDPVRLRRVMKARIGDMDLVVLDEPWKRIYLLIKVWSQESPAFRGLMADFLERPQMLKAFNLTAIETINNDNRYLERGDPERKIPAYFRKPPKYAEE